MTVSRAIPLSAHAATEMVAAPAIIAAPLLLGFGPAASVIGFLIGAFLLGLAVQAAGPGRTIPLSAHAGFDYALATVAGFSGLLPFAILYFSRVGREERMMSEAFGSDYEEHRRNTGRLFPKRWFR